MSGYVRWKDVRAEHVERAGGEQAVEAGKQELLAQVSGRKKLPRTAITPFTREVSTQSLRAPTDQ